MDYATPQAGALVNDARVSGEQLLCALINVCVCLQGRFSYRRRVASIWRRGLCSEVLSPSISWIYFSVDVNKTKFEVLLQWFGLYGAAIAVGFSTV